MLDPEPHSRIPAELALDTPYLAAKRPPATVGVTLDLSASPHGLTLDEQMTVLDMDATSPALSTDIRLGDKVVCVGGELERRRDAVWRRGFWRRRDWLCVWVYMTHGRRVLDALAQDVSLSAAGLRVRRGDT